ncbi:MAG: hypothetical protein QXK94_05645 [Candidatus Jordarchaeales archaeon]
MNLFKEKLHAAIQEYNKYRAPEVVAELVQVGEKDFGVFFSGSFWCRSCGVYDYLDDLRIILEDLGIRVRIDKFEEFDDGVFAVYIVEGDEKYD